MGVEVQLCEVSGFGSVGRGEGHHMGELRALPWVVAPPECGLQLALGARDSLLSSKLLLRLGNSVCSVGAPPTEAALPSAPFPGSQEPSRRR